MFNNMLSRSPVRNKSEVGYLILGKIFNGRKIEGPYYQVFSMLHKKFVDGELEHNEYIKQIHEQKYKYDRYLAVFNLIYQIVLKEQNLIHNIELRRKLMPEINHKFGNLIGLYIHNDNFTLEDINKKYNKIHKFQNRGVYINKLIEGMSQHSDFQRLPNQIFLYFGKYFNKYMTEPDYTLPELLYDLEMKHKCVLEHLPPRFDINELRKNYLKRKNFY